MWRAVIVCVFVYWVQSAPMTKNEATSYLKKYGYMSNGNFRDAMMNFQKFMGLKMTGGMNEESEKVMKKPRCGLRDMNHRDNDQRRRKRYDLQGSRWKLAEITYRINQYSNKIKRETIDRDIRDAFNIWSKYTNKIFTAKASGKVDIDIGFYSGDHNDGAAFDGPGAVLAHAFYPIFGGDVHFDESEDWTSGQQNAINFKEVAVHEIGHTVGLYHSENKDAIMFPTYHGYITVNDLNQDDVDGIRKLYTWSYANY